MAGFTEDASLHLLPLPEEDGVVTIGDLYDCNSSKSVGYNLFGPLTDKHVIAYPLQDSNYTLTQCKDFSEKLTAIEFGFELECTVWPKPVLVVGGGADFKGKFGKLVGDDEIICSCRKDYFSVRTLNEIKNNIDSSIKQKILNGSLKATHVVTEVITGGKLCAEITITDRGEQHLLYLKGFVNGTIEVFIASIKAEASMWIADQEDKLDTTIDIKITSTPPVKAQPKNLTELLKVVNEFNAHDEQAFKMIKDSKNQPYVTGVPLRFTLVPVSAFLQMNSNEMTIPIQKRFKIVDDELKDSLLRMFTTLKDFQYYEYIKERVLKRDERLKQLIQDPENQLTIAITEQENYLKQLSFEFQGRAHRVCFDYQQGLEDTTALRELLADFQKEFDLCRIHNDALEYAVKGRQQLLDVQSLDYNPEENAVTFFTNTADLEDWLESSNSAMNVILQTQYQEGSNQGSFGTILALFDLSKSLQEIGIQVGILYPNVSTEFSIEFISNGSFLANAEKKFMGNQVVFAINILRIAIGQGFSVEKRLHSTLAALNSITLPLKAENLMDMTSLVATTMNFETVKVCETFLQLRALIAKDDKWKFVLAVDVADTFIEGLTCFKRLKTFLQENLPELEYDLIVGTFGSQIKEQMFSAAPAVMIFRNNTLKAVCMDNLDLQVLLQEFVTRRNNLTGSNDPNLETLSLQNMTAICLHPERARFAAAVAILWGDREYSLVNYSHGSFQTPADPFISLTIELIRAALSEDHAQVVAAGAKICLTYKGEDEFKNFLNILKTFKWDETKEAFSINSIHDWRNLKDELRNYYYSNDVFLSILNNAVSALEEHFSDKHAYNSIRNVIELEECPLELRVELEDLLSQPFEDEKDRIIDLIDAMTLYIDKYEANIMFEDVRGDVREDYVAKYNIIFKKLQRCVKELKTRLDYQTIDPYIIIEDVKKSAGDKMEAIINDLEVYKDALPNVYLQGALKIFEIYMRQITIQTRFQHLSALTDYLDQYFSESPSKELPSDIITRYILAIKDRSYPDAGTWPKTLSFSNRQSYYQVLDILSKSIVHPALKDLFINFDIITGTASEAHLVKIIETLGNHQLTDQNYRDLWENPKFLQLMQPGIKSPVVLNSIKHFQCQSTTDNLISNFVPDFVPSDFSKEIIALGVADHIHFDYNKVWQNVFDFLQVLKIISIRARLPTTFHQTLWENVIRNTELKETLQRFQVLYFWNEAGQYFEEPWDLSTVRSASVKNQEWIQKDIDNSTTITKLELTIYNEDSDEHTFDDESSEVINLDSKWNKLTGGSLKRLTKVDLYQFIDPLYKPKVGDQEMTSFMSQVIPYVLQQLQHLDFTTLTSKNICECVEKLRDQFEPDRAGNIILDTDDENEENPPISRLDVLTCILTSVDTSLALWLLSTLNRYPSPLPLVIPKISMNPSKEFKCLLPWMKTLTSSGNGSSTLFSDPYKLIVCVRTGNHHAGKSQILNTVLKPDHFFSSRNVPGSNTGKPFSLPGFVEFVELTSNSCQSEVWNALSEENLSGDPILLVNVHGDIFHYPDTLDLLAKLASSFLVFHMPTDWTNAKETAREIQNKIRYPKSRNTIHVMVDPHDEVIAKVKPSDIINTTDLANGPDVVLERLKNILVSCVLYDELTKEEIPAGDSLKYDSIEMAGNVETTLSSKIISICTDSSCKLVKDNLTLHDNYPLGIPDFNRIWTETADLRQLISLFVSIILLPISRRRIAFAHLSTRLSQGAFSESRDLRHISETILPFLEKEIEADRLNFDMERVVNLQKYVRDVQLRQQNQVLITLQDFFNELMAIYEFYDQPNPAEEIVSSWPEVYAQHFYDGNPIELNCRQYPTWTDNFFLSIMNLQTSLKLFVVSVLGPAGSGKSRLLNDIFGTVFPTRPQARTQGISLSLVHLQESSKNSIANDVDALLILDTEGICSLDAIGDHEAETEQRKMIATVLSLSHMVIFNFNGAKKSCVKYLRNLPSGNSENISSGNLLELPLIATTRLGNDPLLEILQATNITEMPKQIFMVHQEVHHGPDTDEENINAYENVEELKLAFETAASVSNIANIEIGRDKKLENLYPAFFQNDLDFDAISFVLGKIETDGENYHKNISSIRQKVTTVLKNTKEFPTVIEWFNTSQMVQNWFADANYENSSFPCNSNSIQQLQMYNKIRNGSLNDFKSAVEAALESHRKTIEEDIEEAVEKAVDDLEFLREKLERFLGSCDLTGSTDDNTVKTPCSFCKTAIVLASKVKIEAKNIIGETGLENSVNMYFITQADYHRRYGRQLIAAAEFRKNRVELPATGRVFYMIPWDMKYIIADKIQADLDNREFNYKGKLLILEECRIILKQLVANQVQLITISRLLIADAEEEYKNSSHLVIPNLWQAKNSRSGDSVVIFDTENKPTFSDNWEQDEWLHLQLQGMLQLIFRETDDANIFRIGMIRKLKEKIDDSVEQFQIRHKSDIDSGQKWKVHTRGLSLFYQHALSEMKKWNELSDHNPLTYVLRHEDYYMKDLDNLYEDIAFGKKPSMYKH